nr:surface protein-like [Aegilops tauschii subsp. strangulata]
MAVDDEMSRRFLPWGLTLRSGSGYRVTPRPDEPVYVTGAYLLDSESAVGQGAVDACVHIDTRNLLSALLSAANPRVELQTPVRLEMDKECCFHVVPHGGDSDAEADTDTDADTGADVDADADDNADADAVIVMFEGFLVTPQPLDTEEEEDDDDVEEDETGRNDDDEYEEKEEETDSEVDQDVARASSAGGNAKELRQVVAITMAFLGILLSVSMLAFLGLI